MLVASLGSVAAFDLGISPCLGAEEASQRLTFGDLEPLVSLMQETPPEKLMPLLVAKLQSGTQLKTLVSAAALANARAFGGNDYTGYHTFMDRHWHCGSSAWHQSRETGRVGRVPCQSRSRVPLPFA